MQSMIRSNRQDLRLFALAAVLLAGAGFADRASADGSVRTEKAACATLKRRIAEFYVRSKPGVETTSDSWLCDFSTQSDRDKYILAVRSPCSGCSGLVGWFSVAKKDGEISSLDGMLDLGAEPSEPPQR
jgi:hypothetical protein